MIKINLLPEKAIKKDVKNKEFIILSVVSLIVVLIVVVLLRTSQAAKVSERETKIDNLNREIEELKKIVSEVDKFKKDNEELKRKLDIIGTLKKNKTGPVRILDELSKIIPDEVWIDSYQDVGGQLRIQGTGLDDDTISVFLKKLDESPYLSAVELLFIRPGDMKGRKVRKFEISATLNYAGENS